MRSILYRILELLWAAILAYFIALAGQGIWTGLLIANLHSTPAIPWSIPIMAMVLWVIWRYLDGWGWPRSTARLRHQDLRAKQLSREVFGWALLAGGLSVAALAGFWMVMAKMVRMPGNSLVNPASIPPLTVSLFIGMGSLVSPILEQAGFFGYGQSFLERRFSRIAAVVIISIYYALGPHPPTGSALWPRLVFYFLTGFTFAMLAYLTQSILPGLIVHILGILAFFVFVWPYDPVRLLVSQGGLDAFFWIYLAQGVIFTGLTIMVFRKLGRAANRVRIARLVA